MVKMLLNVSKLVPIDVKKKVMMSQVIVGVFGVMVAKFGDLNKKYVSKLVNTTTHFLLETG